MISPPCSEAELLARADALAGASLAEIAAGLGCGVPRDPRRAKGWVGGLLERALGADAGARPLPDFVDLGVELKTVPVDAAGRPRESTFVCMVPLTGDRRAWTDSPVRRKLARVLWIPIVGATAAPGGRRIGRPRLWSPGEHELAVLRADWDELMEFVALGRLAELDARLGSYLQIRPKALDGRQLTPASDETGAGQRTLPRGFYLRARFTRRLLDGGADEAPRARDGAAHPAPPSVLARTR